LQTGLSGVTHIGANKDYSPVIKAALESEGFTQGEQNAVCLRLMLLNKGCLVHLSPVRGGMVLGCS